MIDTVNGKIRARKWPRSRGRAKTKADQKNRDDFRQAEFIAKYMAPGLHIFARDVSGNTPILTRDILTMLLYNRLFSFKLPGGKELWPVTARKDVEDALGTISQTPGDVLVRTETGWQGQPVGGAGIEPTILHHNGIFMQPPNNAGTPIEGFEVTQDPLGLTDPLDRARLIARSDGVMCVFYQCSTNRFPAGNRQIWVIYNGDGSIVSAEEFSVSGVAGKHWLNCICIQPMQKDENLLLAVRSQSSNTWWADLSVMALFLPTA